MKKLYFSFVFTLLITTHSFAVDLDALRQLCQKGDYNKALNELDAMKMPELIKDNSFSPNNDFFLYCAEVYQNTLSKSRIKKLANYYTERSNADSVKWNTQNLILIYAYVTNEQYTKAQELCIKELVSSSAKKGKKDRDRYIALSLLTDLQLNAENIPTAEKLCLSLNNKTEELYAKADREYVKSLQRLADLYLLSGNLSSCQSYLEQIEVLLKGKKSDDSYDKAAQLISQGLLYLRKGEPAVASSNLKRAAFILEQKVPAAHPLLVKHALIYAELAKFLGNYGKGYKHLADLQCDENLAWNLRFQVDLGITELYYNAGKLSYGFEIINTIYLPADYSVKGPTAFKYNMLKIIPVEEAGKKEEAYKMYTQLSDSIKATISIGHYLYIETKIQQGTLYYKTGQYKLAMKSMKDAIEGLKIYGDANHPYYIEVQQQLALICWADGNKKKAEKYFTETAENYIYQYNKVFAILSEKEKNIFYADIRKFYDKFNAFMLEEYKTNPSIVGTVYNNQLANKAILFNSTQELKNSIYSGSDTSLISKLQKWNSIRESLAKAYKLMAEGIKVDQELVENLEKKALEMEEYIQLKASINKSKDGNFKKSTNWYNVQSYLKKDEAAVEIIRINGYDPTLGGSATDQVYYAVLFLTKKTKKYPEIIVVDDGAELETRQSKYYRNMIRFRIMDTLSYVKFWKPLMQNKKLANAKTLYISPDGIYNQINLNTLYSSVDSQYVIDKFNIRLLTNTKDVVTFRTQAKKKSELPDNSILVGYPEYYTSTNPNIAVAYNPKNRNKNSGSATRSFRGDGISELPGTKVEIETIKNLLSDSTTDSHSTRSYLASEANETNMKKITSPGILHVATHGFFNDPTKNTSEHGSVLEDVYQENPLLLCGILLSGAGYAYVDEVLHGELEALNSGKNLDDGILTAYEAMNMNLDGLELAILSACETGLGKIQNGEGVYGFQRALQSAGAMAILMSLWKVDDEATKKMMIYFYTNWNKTGDKIKAFEYAQKKIKQEFKDPVYWGAFIMVGW